MRFTYDPNADALAVELGNGVKSAKMVKLAPDVNVDFDKRGRLVTVEVLNASLYYSQAELADLETPVVWLSVAEAVKESGLAANTLREQIRKGKLEATKRGRDWVIALSNLWNYLDHRDPRGRPSPNAPRKADVRGLRPAPVHRLPKSVAKKIPAAKSTKRRSAAKKARRRAAKKSR